MLTPAHVSVKAIFGQYTYDITDELELQAGVRMNWDDSDRDTNVIRREQGAGDWATCLAYGLTGTEYLDPQTNGIVTAGVTQTGPSYGCRVVVASQSDITTKNVDTEVPTWKVGLNWSPTDDDFFYAFYARGYKAATHQGTGVKPEQIDDYEFGWKGSLFDGALTGDLNFYYMDYADLQGSSFNIGDPTGADTTNSNVGDATIQGIEFSGQMFFGNLGINFSAALSDSEVNGIRTADEASLPAWAENDLGGALDWLPQCGVGNVTTYGDGNPNTASTARVVDPADATLTIPNGNCFNYDPFMLDLNGQSQIQAPDVSYNIAVDYEFAYAGGTLTPRLSYSYTDESWSNVIQTDYYRNDERGITDFTLAYDRDDWTVQLYVRNLTEDTYIASARDGWIGYGAPRTYGVRARLNF